MRSNKTSQSQLNAAHKYYQEHKDTINYIKSVSITVHIVSKNIVN